jgi:hypothetical protein
MIGKPVVSATAFANPVVEPPPTDTSRSTVRAAAAVRARATTSTGTCMATSWCHTATGSAPATRLAKSRSDSPAMTIIREALSSTASAASCAAASPEANRTRCARVS